jgi:hypothetical protein
VSEVRPRSEQHRPRRAQHICMTRSYKVEIIAPASDRQIMRAQVEERLVIRETSAMYQRAVQPVIGEVLKGNSLGWVYNILNHEKEQDR